ncbi:MAG: PadR family transcriptional regulator [Methanobacteriota archaeon]
MGPGEVEDFASKIGKDLRSGVLSLLILNILKAEGKPTYGYDLIKSIRALTNGKLAFQEGTIYPILRMMEEKGLLSSEWQKSVDGPPRKYYKLTALGREAAAEARDQWNGLSITVNDVLNKLRGV